MAERIGDLAFGGIEAAITDVPALAVGDVLKLSGEVELGRDVRQLSRNGLGEVSGWIDLTGQDIDDAGSAGLSTQPALDDGVGLVIPLGSAHR